MYRLKTRMFPSTFGQNSTFGSGKGFCDHIWRGGDSRLIFRRRHIISFRLAIASLAIDVRPASDMSYTLDPDFWIGHMAGAVVDADDVFAVNQVDEYPAGAIQGMKTLARYVLWDFLSVLLLSLAGMTLFMLVVGVTTQAIREGLSLGPVVQILPFIVPESMRFSIPAASLLASCVVFGRLAGDNEMVAMKSLGISPWRVLAPVFAVAFLISVGAVWINDLAVSWGRPGMSRVVMNSIEQIAYAVLRTHKSYSRDGFSITVREVDGKRLVLPVIRFRDPRQEGAEFTIAAREAQLRRSDDATALGLLLVDATVEGPNGMRGVLAGENEYLISLERPVQMESPSDFPLYEIPRQRKELSKQMDHLASSMAVESAISLICGERPPTETSTWRNRQVQLDQMHYRHARFVTEPWRRWANSFSCLFFVVVGAPLALRLRHRDFITTFFAAFVPVLLVYYPIMTYGVDRAKVGALPQYAVWLGNFICLLWGLVLLRKVFRY